MTASTGRLAKLAGGRWADGQTVDEDLELAPVTACQKYPIVATAVPGAHLPIAGVCASWPHATTPCPFIR
jgi:hypothetical protein